MVLQQLGRTAMVLLQLDTIAMVAHQPCLAAEAQHSKIASTPMQPSSGRTTSKVTLPITSSSMTPITPRATRNHQAIVSATPPEVAAPSAWETAVATLVPGASALLRPLMPEVALASAMRLLLLPARLEASVKPRPSPSQVALPVANVRPLLSMAAVAVATRAAVE